MNIKAALKNPLKISELTPQQIASICDHTFLKRADAFWGKQTEGKSVVFTRRQAFFHFLQETLSSPLKPYALCVRPEDCLHAKKFLKENNETEIKLTAAIGFPDGSWCSPLQKTTEARIAIEEGAEEIDTTLAYEQLKANEIDHVTIDIQSVVSVAHQHDVKVKLILETSELTNEQIKTACLIASKCEVDMVKTSTGYGSHGATVEALRIIKENFSGGIKISGGVTPDNIRELLTAASREPEGFIHLDPQKIRIGESSLLKNLT